MKRLSAAALAQITAALKERDAAEAQVRELKAAHERNTELLKTLNHDLMTALKENRRLEKELAESKALAQGRLNVALEARRELTKVAKQHRVTEWTDTRALAANDRDLVNA